jgi:hypothetical protein
MSATEDLQATMPQRLLWVLGVPLASCFVPWLVLLAAPDVWIGWFALMATGLVPVLGAVGVMLYRLIAPEPVRLWPLLPYAVVAVVFAIGWIGAANQSSDSDGLEFLWVLLVGITLPFLAFGGGLASYLWNGPRSRTTRSRWLRTPRQGLARPRR